MSTGDAIEWLGWEADEPSEVFECAVFTANQWRTADCNERIRYVCERGTSQITIVVGVGRICL